MTDRLRLVLFIKPLIEELKRRGHSAYANADLEDVKQRAQALPENDIPLEIVRLLPLDNAHDKLQPNKNATPVRKESNLEEVKNNMSVLRMNAVVSEKSHCDVGDESAQLRAKTSEFQVHIEWSRGT